MINQLKDGHNLADQWETQHQHPEGKTNPQAQTDATATKARPLDQAIDDFI